MNHTRFLKEDHLPDWARRDNKDTKGGRVECVHMYIYVLTGESSDFEIEGKKNVVWELLQDGCAEQN